MVSIAITNKYFLNYQNNLKCKVIPYDTQSTKIKKDTTCVSFKIQFLVRVNLAVTFDKNHQPRNNPTKTSFFSYSYTPATKPISNTAIRPHTNARHSKPK